MGIVSRMARPKAISTEMERVLREHFGGSATAAGANVSCDTAMQQATVYGCVNVLSRTLGQLPCHLYQRIDATRKEKALDHDLYELLHDQPNEWMTAPEFWGMCMNHLSLRGNFFVLKQRAPVSKRVVELLPLAPGIVREVTQDAGWSLKYKCILPDGTEKEYPASEIMHVRGMVINGYMGVNPIQYIRESIGLGLAAEEFGARYFGSGTHPGMIVEHPGKLSDGASKNLRESLAGAHSGLGKAHRLLLLEEGMKAQKITIDPKDAQFLELRQFQRSEIVDIFFATPLSLMAKSDSTPTYASAEQFSLGFVVYALMPWLVNIEKAIRRDLLVPEDRKKYYAKFRPEGLQRGDLKTRFAAYATAITKEIMNPNECRELEDMNPYDGGDVFAPRTSTVKGDKEDGSKQ